MKPAFVIWVSTLCAGVFLMSAGCVGPHYSEHQLIVNGKDAPVIRGPHDPAIAGHLTTNLWASSSLPDRAAEVGVTPFKAMGIQGWKDFHMHARARGHVMQHEVGSNGFRTVDLRLKSLTVDNVRIHWKGTRYMRVEIYLGKVQVEPAILDDTNALLRIEGKLVWDEDGWFEIHPESTGDIRLEPTHPWWHWW
jgi:hypothetical protein